MDECQNRYIEELTGYRGRDIHMEKKKKIAISIGVAVAALIALYMGLSYFFMNHFYFTTTINGVAVGGASIEGAKAKIEKAVDNYELHIIERDDSSHVISGEDIQMEIAWKQELESYMASQNGFAWIVKLFAPDTYDKTLGISYNETALLSEMNALPCMQEDRQIKPVNACATYEDGVFAVKEEVLGTAIDKSKFQRSLKDCIKNIDEELYLAEEGCYYEPTITSDNEKLETAVTQLNKALDTVITYEIGKNKEVLDASVFADWLYVNNALEAAVDEEALSAFVKDMGRKYNTAYSAKKLMTSYGIEVTIPNSHYGWKIDNKAEKGAIVEEIFAGEKVTRDLHYSMTAHSHEGPDYGNSYVEINLTAQHLFMYVDGELIVETDFVSGNLANNWNTPTGAFSLTYKQKDAVLRGENYVTPVTFWMPYFGNVGMHDATWRSEFGGSIYKTDGSHGCVNLPWSKAKIIYENIEQGFPVLCYELPGTEPVPEVIDPLLQFYLGF